jgi:hypothetical protein
MNGRMKLVNTQSLFDVMGEFEYKTLRECTEV